MSVEIISIQRKKLDEMADVDINVSKYRSLEARYNSVIEAVELLEMQNNTFRKEIDHSRKLLLNAQKNVDINKKIVVDMLTAANAEKQSYLGEIADLKVKLSRS